MSSSSKRGLPQQVRMRHTSHFVDELVTRSEQPIGKIVQIGLIEPDPDQPRSDFGDIDELAESIRAKGVLEPILVRPLPRESGEEQRYRIISGERRFRAANVAELPEVPVIEMHIGDDEALEIALIENLQRKDLDPFEEAEGLNSLRERFGYTHEQIATTVAKSRTVITEALSLLKIPDDLRQIARNTGLLSKSLLLEIAKAGDEEAMGELLQQVLEGGLNRDQVRDRTRDRVDKPASARRPTFRFSDPEADFKVALTFDREAVERRDVIRALERVLEDLRQAEESDEEDQAGPQSLF